MSKAYFRRTPLSLDFDELKEGETIEKGYTVTRIGQYTKVLNKETKERNLQYEIEKDGVIIKLDDKQIKKFKKNRVSADKIFEKLTKQFPEKKKINLASNKWKNIWIAALVFTFIFGIGIVVAYFVSINEKNFTDEILSLEEETSFKKGDFVEMDADIVGSYSVTEITTETTYGVETSETEEEGNMYLLLTFPEALEGATFIYRYGPDSDMAKKIESLTVDEYFVEGLNGEIKGLDKLEKIDEGEQIDDAFASLLDSFADEYGWNLEDPEYLIDGRVTQGDFNNVIIAVGIMSVLTVGAFIVTAGAYKKNQSYVGDIMKGIMTGSPIQKE